jgi:hypothetical protein
MDFVGLVGEVPAALLGSPAEAPEAAPEADNASLWLSRSDLLRLPTTNGTSPRVRPSLPASSVMGPIRQKNIRAGHHG